ncbi:MAG: enoyl-CoA hydratase/isomerase family protein [Deltaproteobacteria bacterium]|nr:MAG: enoyl-CoA hydratase/isomerase family protein [Deltaproteobacteria bacterium]
MNDNTIKKEVLDKIAIIYLNRPSVYNAINMDLAKELTDSLIQISKEKDIWGVIITGKGEAFCSGGDLKWISKQGKDYYKTFYTIVGQFHRAITEIKNMKKPVVAAINGMAAGGGFSLALACDFRIMESHAQLILAYTSRGLTIDGGGTYFLPRIVGIAKALEIIAFDRPISAQEALNIGLVTEVVQKGDSVKRAIDFIKDIIKKVPLHSYGICKNLIHESFRNPLELQMEKEREAIAFASQQPDGKEGILSFIEKRAPVYKNS